jgi:hypothetical protein
MVRAQYQDKYLKLGDGANEAMPADLAECMEAEDDDTLAAAAAAVLCWCHNATRILDRGLHYLCVVPVALFVLRRRCGNANPIDLIHSNADPQLDRTLS